MKMKGICSLTIGLALWTVPTLGEPTDTTFTYQGQLKQNGQPATGDFDLVFQLFEAEVGGSPIGDPVPLADVPVTNGLFTVQLNVNGQFGPSAFNGEKRWLGVEVNGTPLSPRQPVTATPYALFSLNADTLDGLNSTVFLQSIPTPLWLLGDQPAWSIIRGENTSAISTSIGVKGVSTAGTGLTYGGYFENSSTGGRGVYGTATAATGTTYGGYFESDSTDGRGVFGSTTAASGLTYGVRGQSASTDGHGVFGSASAATGVTRGVYGTSSSVDGRGVAGFATADTGATYGGYFESSSSTSGRGVYGLATSDFGNTQGGLFQSRSGEGTGVRGYASATLGDNYGGKFQSDSTGGTGAFALANAAIGPTYGLWAQSNSASGTGVYGLANAATGDTYGGYFQADSTDGYGVFAQGGYYGGRFESDSTTGRGVYGYVSATTGTTYGVYGLSESPSGRSVYGFAGATGAGEAPYGVRGYCSTATSGYAVYAAGDMGASGTKSFHIDHPSDPENKYLLHYSVESPEVLNAYSGTVTLNERGEAVVVLPAYFAAINKAPRYTLTAMGAPMPMLHVAEKIRDEALLAGEQTEPGQPVPVCSFRIAGGVPAGEVSWEVKAVRNDLRTRLHGAPVEREKTGPERGKYQHPEYYGLGPEMGMDHHAALPSAARGEAEPTPRPARDDDCQSR